MHLSDRAYRQLKRMILARRFGPDEVLSERALATLLSVSRIPVREAIRSLESEGLLIVIPRRGIYVRRLTIGQVRELYEVRQAIEGMAAHLCAARAGAAEMREQRRKLERLAASGNGIDRAAVQRASSQFHRTMFETCGNTQLLALYKTIEPQIDLNLRFTAVHAPARIEHALYEHLEIAKAIEARDPRRAERRTWRHLENGKIARIEVLSKLARKSENPGTGSRRKAGG